VILLDTHALLWLAEANPRLGRKSRSLIESRWSDGQVAVCAISFWEAGRLAKRGRVELPAPILEWRTRWLNAGLHEFPLDGVIAIRSLDLAGLPEDPADRFIVAAALTNQATLVTADQKILEWRHSLERHDATT
jgi:PIN domain nuclease of toxin-antitoxin system